MKNSKLSQRSAVYNLCLCAVVAALYAVLTIILAPISYGAVQCRVSEVLCILPYFIPSSAWGLFLGCLIANLLTGNIMDIIFGSLATLLAGMCTAAIGKHGRKSGAPTLLNSALACAMPVIFNGLVVGAVITVAYEGANLFENFGVFGMNALWVAIGEAVVLFVLGLPLMRTLPKKKYFTDVLAKLGQ